jgi:hypothetical protein
MSKVNKTLLGLCILSGIVSVAGSYYDSAGMFAIGFSCCALFGLLFSIGMAFDEPSNMNDIGGRGKSK